MYNLSLNYLHIHTKKLKQLKDEITHLQSIANLAADKNEIETFVEALEELKTVVNGITRA